MSRSFRGRPEPGEDNQIQPVSPSKEASPGGTQTPNLIKFSSINKHGDLEDLSVDPLPVDIGKRLVAGLIDVVTGYMLEIILNCVPLVNVYIHDQLPMVCFLMVRDALFDGRGVGKNLMGLQVVDMKTGQPASLIQSIKRNMVVFWPYLILSLVNLLLKINPDENLSSLVTNFVSGASTVYLLAVIPYEFWRVYSRVDGLRWGDKLAGTATIPADMDFSNPLSK